MRVAQPRLFGIGSVVLLVGLLLMGRMVLSPFLPHSPDHSPHGSATETLAPRGDDGPSRVWPIAGGLALALGATLMSLSLNRWGPGNHSGPAGHA